MNPPVLFDVLSTPNKKKVGIATLNRPQTLNGLSLPMGELLADQLRQWENDDAIALVILNGGGEKAFCAGGDLHGLYESMQQNKGRGAWENDYARRFFDIEYHLDYHIHTYSKPLLCWGNGIVMGGGVGLLMGASHRVVTETTRFAMPEITIGFFPDVGGTWMLGRLPGGTGLFLALTAAQLQASDCRFLGLADYTLESHSWPALLNQIESLSWSDSRADNDVRLHDLLHTLTPESEGPRGPLQQHYSLIKQACEGPDLETIGLKVERLGQQGDPWLARAAHVFGSGAPGSARLCFTLLRRARLLSLAQAFRQEYIVSLQCSAAGDFQEGIRALLIDKDKQPRWNPSSPAQANEQWVERFFAVPWPESATHPLADLGK